MVASRGSFYKPQLDALRAIAVSAVLVHHFLPVWKFIPEDFLTLGLLAVRLFFVLSGYLITGILLRSRELNFRTALKQFYIRRTLRIFPIYYLTLFILLVLGVERVRQFIHWYLLYFANILFLLHPTILGTTGHFWTLAVEEQFYLVWPFLILLVPARHLLKLIICAIVFGVCWKTYVAFTMGDNLMGGVLPFACLDSLGIGSLLALIEHDERLRKYRERFLRSSLVVGTFIILLQIALYLLGRRQEFFFSTSYLGVSLVFVWLVGRAAVGFAGKTGALLEAGPLLYLGRISYGMYLYHNFMPSLVRYLTNALGLREPGTLTMFLCATALTILVASVSWQLVERPLNHLKDSFRYGARKGRMLAQPASGIDA